MGNQEQNETATEPSKGRLFDRLSLNPKSITSPSDMPMIWAVVQKYQDTCCKSYQWGLHE